MDWPRVRSLQTLLNELGFEVIIDPAADRLEGAATPAVQLDGKPVEPCEPKTPAPRGGLRLFNPDPAA